MRQSRPHRSTLRLREFDYSTPGAYFVTICTYHKTCFLGDVRDDRMLLTNVGSMVHATWSELPDHYPAVHTDAFIVMPNHIHGIIVLNGDHISPPADGQAWEPAPTFGHRDASPLADGQAWEPAPTFGLPDIIHRFKSLTTRQFAPLAHDRDQRPVRSHLWQRNYYEHVIRDDNALQRIREYIANNPLSWALDRENPSARPASLPSRPAQPWEV